MTGAGADVFVSYNRDDILPVREIVAGLDARGIATQLDERIPAGTRWQEELRASLLRARVTLVMIGPGGMGRWQQVEVDTAIDLAVQRQDEARRIVPVLLPGASVALLQQQLFLAGYEWVDLRDGLSADRIDRLVADLRGEAPSSTRLPASTRPPASTAARPASPSISASHGSVAAGSITNSTVIVGATQAKTKPND